ncbi:hypothetical protein GCM10022225_08240 [Plantactinospora mayteni]|uniref:Uncharacterized protein n=1 Tax=Plantactinospora mayteni TaxID=566021 RepID=A0ABQ4EII2_9ACTN|nr:hypothetical protein [Plantactinospora mayteni]GIG94430.1 hypothetical protein Pma05_10030 [Plantactinospora mayteni]
MGVLVAYPLATAREARYRVGPAFDGPVLVRVLLHELAGCRAGQRQRAAGLLGMF